MSDDTRATADGDRPTGRVRLFHPRGPAVELPVPCTGWDYRTAFAAVASALDAGFLAQAPGLEEGEEREQVGWVVKTLFERNGKVTPCLLLYSASEALRMSILRVYLDTAEQIGAVERASGLRVADLPEYEGADKPERGKAQKTDRFFVKAPRPFGVVYKLNRKYDEQAKAAAAARGEVYKVPRRLFVRWADAGSPTPQAQPTGQAPARRNQGEGGGINKEQWDRLAAALQGSGVGTPAFLRWCGYARPSAIPASAFERLLGHAQKPPAELLAAQQAPQSPQGGGNGQQAATTGGKR
jgi:hypothetical protein